MLSISVQQLQQKMLDEEDLVLIDVRQPWEHALFNIGGTLIPLDTLSENIARITRDKPVVLYCEKGIRSGLAIQRLRQRYDFTNLINLTGGMDAWKKMAKP
jgi:adenylyltransferase/sulfurtransferase